MNDSSLPRETLRMLGIMLVVAFDFALETGREAIEKFKPLVEPPEDIRVTSTTGCLYSGLVVVDRGEVIAGIVVATGFDPVRAIAGRPTPPPPAVPTHFERASDRSGRLPGWADDTSRYADEEPPWRR